MPRNLSSPIIPIAAAVWALGHAAMTTYWALGGTAGLSLLSESIREQADARDPWFVALIWSVVAAKVVAAMLALTLLNPERVRSGLAFVLMTLAALGGVGMALYGFSGIVAGAAALLGIVDTETDATAAYVLLWSPLWLLGGLLFMATALRARRCRRANVEASPSGAPR